MIKNLSLSSQNIDRLMNMIEVLLLIIFIPLILRYQIQLLSYLDWGDETGTIVTSKMMASGQKLFSDIHELHGPLAYLPGVLTEQFGDFGVKGHRVLILILQWLALFAIYFSPLIRDRLSKIIYCLVCATVMVIYFPEIFGHTYIFQVIAGLFFIIILAQYTLPAILIPSSLGRFQIIIGNLLIASLPFLAFTYIPISIALFFASFTKKNKLLTLASATIGLLINILLLGLFGSILGFIALHFWINLAVSRKFIEGEALGSHYIFVAALKSITNDLARFGVFLLICASIAKLAQKQKEVPWRSLILGLGIASLLVRSMGFQGLPFLYLSLSMPLVFFYGISHNSHQRLSGFVVLIPLLCVCMVKLILLIPANIADRQSQTSSAFSQLVQKITNKEDRIIAWPFKNDEYILSDRLPASGNFWYLPWQGTFYENPLFGMKINSCNEINAQKPKIIFIEKYPFGGVAWDDYVQPCIDELLLANYTKVKNKGYYIRNDIFEEKKALIKELN
jgi:hypothetical protein